MFLVVFLEWVRSEYLINEWKTLGLYDELLLTWHLDNHTSKLRVHKLKLESNPTNTATNSDLKPTAIYRPGAEARASSPCRIKCVVYLLR